MDKDRLSRKLVEYKIVPVVVLEEPEKAANLAKALVKGGLPIAEITFRTEGADKAIKIMKTNFPEMLVGAGTVLSIEQVDKAVLAGAEFVVSPGFNPKVVKYCTENNINIIPGCLNPTDIEMALDMGITTIKFFPAEAAGGIKMIKAMSDPYQMIRFMPTGGINTGNIKDYLECKNVVACGGSWITDKKLIKANDYEKITSLAKEAVLLVKE